MTTVNADRAKELVQRFSEQQVLVVGDVMLDRYIYGSVERISPEAPVPVVRVYEEVEALGGAANVTRNIRALGGVPLTCGVVGGDQAGRGFMEVMDREGIDRRGILQFPQVQTTVKTRVLGERQQVVRVDWDAPLEMEPEMQEQVCARAAELAQTATALIVEDYGKGMVVQEVVNAALGVARERRIPVGFDPKENHQLRLSGVTVATPNLREAFVAAGIPEKQVGPEPEKDVILRKVGGILLQKWRPDLLVITLGPHGMLLLGRDTPPRAIPTRAREVYDVSGAGDTVIATCVLALAAGATHYEAAGLANYAAGVVVGKVGTACCSAAELLQCFD